MLTLCYAPRSCAIGIHVILEEIGKPYNLKKVDLTKREQHTEEYLAVNPKGKVPALIRHDGSVLTEFPAIAVWLAMTNPEKRLLSTDPDEIARALEVVDYVTATLHAQSWSRFFWPVHHSEAADEHPKISAKGREIGDRGLSLLDKNLAGKEWLVGNFSIADCALYFFEFWVKRFGWKTMPANIEAHYARMDARPSVQATLAAEDLLAT